MTMNDWSGSSDPSEPPSAETVLDAPDEWLCAVGRSLSTGEDVYLNRRTLPLRVVGRSIDNGGYGTDYPYVVIELESNTAEYELRIPDAPGTPTLDGPPSVSGTFVRRIAPADGTPAMVAERSAATFVEMEGELDDGPVYPPVDRDEARATPTGDSRLGTCPECSASVVGLKDERAVCTGCGSWCWIDQWHIAEVPPAE